VAGYAGPPLLGQPARRLLFRSSRGIPRLVNILSHKALLLLYGEGGTALEPRHIRLAALDTPASARPRRWWQALVAPVTSALK
jgi:MSHA biogenesis protein MshM